MVVVRKSSVAAGVSLQWQARFHIGDDPLQPIGISFRWYSADELNKPSDRFANPRCLPLYLAGEWREASPVFGAYRHKNHLQRMGLAEFLECPVGRGSACASGKYTRIAAKGGGSAGAFATRVRTGGQRTV